MGRGRGFRRRLFRFGLFFCFFVVIHSDVFDLGGSDARVLQGELVPLGPAVVEETPVQRGGSVHSAIRLPTAAGD